MALVKKLIIFALFVFFIAIASPSKKALAACPVVCRTQCTQVCGTGGHDRIRCCEHTEICHKVCGPGDEDPPVCTVSSWGGCSVTCGGGTQTNNCGGTQACNTQACNIDPIGWHDSTTCSGSSGWTCDSNNYNQPIDVHFYSEGVFRGSTTANISAEAGVAAACGGNAAHRFIFPNPSSLMDGNTHTVYAYAINIPAGNNPVLSGSPKTITYGKPATPVGTPCTVKGTNAVLSWGPTASWGTCSTGGTYSVYVDGTKVSSGQTLGITSQAIAMIDPAQKGAGGKGSPSGGGGASQPKGPTGGKGAPSGGYASQPLSYTIANAIPEHTYLWKIEAINSAGLSTSTGTYSCYIPAIANDWFTSINGDIYANVIKSTPQSPSPWNPTTLGYGISTILNSSPSSNTSVVGNPIISESGVWANKLPIKNMWTPYHDTFVIPSTATNAPSDFNGLDPTKVYKFSGDISSAVNYTLTSDGVAVVYVTNPVTFTINANFKSASANKRIVFVTNNKVIIGPTIFTDFPTKSSTPNIQAGIITSNTIEFKPNTADPSIVVEGPLVGGAGITFKRKAYVNHGYPTEVVVYNPYILSKLTSQEQTSTGDSANYTGLTTSEIIWEGDL